MVFFKYKYWTVISELFLLQLGHSNYNSIIIYDCDILCFSNW